MSTDRIVSLSAMLVGVAALGVVIYQAQLDRAAQRAQALPYVTISIMSNDLQTYVLVRNTGVGPAILDGVRMRHRGRAIDVDPYDFYVAERGTERAAGLNVDKLIPGRLIPAGEGVLTIGWEGEGSKAMLPELLALFDIGEVPQSWYEAFELQRSGPDKAVIELTYGSVYGDRWRVTSDEVVPKRVD